MRLTISLTLKVPLIAKMYLSSSRIILLYAQHTLGPQCNQPNFKSPLIAKTPHDKDVSIPAHRDTLAWQTCWIGPNNQTLDRSKRAIYNLAPFQSKSIRSKSNNKKCSIRCSYLLQGLERKILSKYQFALMLKWYRTVLSPHFLTVKYLKYPPKSSNACKATPIKTP